MLVAGVVLFWALVITFTLATATWVYLTVCFVTIRKIGRATGYLETPGGQRSGSTKKSKTGSSTQNGKEETVVSGEKWVGNSGFGENFKEEGEKREGS